MVKTEDNENVANKLDKLSHQLLITFLEPYFVCFGGHGKWAYLVDRERGRTSQPYFPLVSTGNFNWGQKGFWEKPNVGHLKYLPLLWYVCKSGQVTWWFSLLIVYRWDGVSVKDTRLTWLITGLCEEGHPTVKFMPQ